MNWMQHSSLTITLVVMRMPIQVMVILRRRTLTKPSWKVTSTKPSWVDPMVICRMVLEMKIVRLFAPVMEGKRKVVEEKWNRQLGMLRKRLMMVTTAIQVCKPSIRLFSEAETLSRPSILASCLMKKRVLGVWQLKVRLPKPIRRSSQVLDRVGRGSIISSVDCVKGVSVQAKKNRMSMMTIGSSESLGKVAWGTCSLPGRGH